MAFNVEEGVQLAINTFGGLITEVPASNVPETGSPDNQDCQYWPGAVGTRDGLKKVFAVPLSSGSPAQVGTITYAKSYVDPKGVIRNLYLDSLGNLWVENVTTSPGAASLLAALPWAAGSYAKSITAFGREYIAISDGLHGTDIPLQYDGTNLDRVTQDGPGQPPVAVSVFGGQFNMALAGSPAASLSRSGNVVTATVANPAINMQVGYQVIIAGVTAAAVDTLISTLVIDNANLPGLATVTMTAPHGLAPGVFVALHDIPLAVVANISAISRQGGVSSVTTATAHGLSDGALININGVGTASFNTSTAVANVVDPTTFTYLQTDADAAVGAGGQVRIAWPFPNTGADQTPGSVFQVVEAPTPTSFTIQINYSNGTWTGGGVTIPWNGTFYVSAVLNATQFQYQQYGPDNITTDIGTVTKNGQLSPGEHQMQVLFLTRNGYVTKPSPPVKFIANGGQYLSVSGIPIGPANIQARILAFTGVRGSQFFYIPVPAMVNGQVVSTSTQINDNFTTSAVLDFSDNTLFASIGINTLGNNLPAQIILDGALGFGHFGSRLITYGQRNRIQNLLNMAFDGGYAPSDPTFPSGWTAAGSPPNPGGALTTTSRFGDAWATTGGGSIFQSFYLDAYGAPIATPRANYTARAWLKGTGTITLTISSVLASFTSTAVLTGTSTNGAWIQAAFSTQMPVNISTDMILSVTGAAGMIVDEISIIYTDTPFLDTILYGSYVNNPEAFDGLSGKFGPANDPRKVMTFGQIRGILFLLTRDPSGSLHSVSDNGTTEPAGWGIYQVGANCGCLSAFGLTVSQADDASSGGGEEWLAWASYSGGRIFGGDQPWKITQEIQPNWEGDPAVNILGINWSAALRIWACNDPENRVIYFGLPIGTATAPSIIYPVDYKGLDTAWQIGQSHPVYRGQGGRMAAGEFCRKWTRWHLTMNGAALTYGSTPGKLSLVLFAGNGTDPAMQGSPILGGHGNVYTLNPSNLVDDDYGPFVSYYVTYFFPSHQLEAALGLGTQRKMLEFFQYLASGTGTLRISFLSNSLSNVWPLNCIRDLSPDPQFDIEHPGASVEGQRIAFKFEGLP